MSDFITLVKTVAPWIGTALAGPFNNMAIQAIADVFGLADKTIETVQSALAGVTPAQMLSLKLADQAFALQMQALGFKQLVDIETLVANDRSDARKMNIATRSRVPALLTCFIVGAFTSTLVLLIKFDIPASNRDILVYMVGQLSGGFTTALAFWLGTTNSSGMKTEMLAKAQPIVL